MALIGNYEEDVYNDWSSTLNEKIADSLDQGSIPRTSVSAENLAEKIIKKLAEKIWRKNSAENLAEKIIKNSTPLSIEIFFSKIC
jgi:hypothetical protein